MRLLRPHKPPPAVPHKWTLLVQYRLSEASLASGEVHADHENYVGSGTGCRVCGTKYTQSLLGTRCPGEGP